MDFTREAAEEVMARVLDMQAHHSSGYGEQRGRQ